MLRYCGELGRSNMGEALRARVKGRVLELLDKADLPEGEEVLVTIVAVAAGGTGEGLRRSFGSWKGTIDVEKLIRDIYEDRLILSRSEPRL
jgi:predicted DNA-binding antitoxin AbrB/MazE fold protein